MWCRRLAYRGGVALAQLLQGLEVTKPHSEVRPDAPHSDDAREHFREAAPMALGRVIDHLHDDRHLA